MDKTKSLYAIYKYDFHQATQRTVLAEAEGAVGVSQSYNFFLSCVSVMSKGALPVGGSLRGGSKGRRRAYIGLNSSATHVQLSCYLCFRCSLNHDAKVRPWDCGLRIFSKKFFIFFVKN